MIKHSCKVLAFNPNIEEEVTLEINDFVLTCFVSVCPYEIKIGEYHTITFDNMFDFEVSIQKTQKEKSIKRVGTSYSYEMRGVLYQGVLDAGIRVQDDFLKSDYTYLDGMFICLHVERLDAHFL